MESIPVIDRLLNLILDNIGGNIAALIFFLLTIIEGYVILRLVKVIFEHFEKAEDRIKKLEEARDNLERR